MRLLGLLLLLLPTFAQAKCTGHQSYILSLRMSFTRSVNAIIPPPEKARIPIVVAVVHKPTFHLFEQSKKLTDEVAEVVTVGKANEIKMRFKKLLRTNTISSYYILEDIPIDGLSQLELRPKDDSSRISLIAQLSPSPAWFVGIDSHDVCQNSKFIEKQGNIRIRNFNSGLHDSESFEIINPIEEGNAHPVEPLSQLDDDLLAIMSLEKGSLSVNWWKILLGALAAAFVFFVLLAIVIPCIRRRRKVAHISVMSQDGTGW